MAQLKETMIDGKLEVVGNIILSSTGASRSVSGIHPDTGDVSSMISLNSSGNTLVGYGGYNNKNGNSHICGNDINHFVASADVSYRPYYRAGDTISFAGNSTNNAVRAIGYVAGSGKNVVFTIPLTKPIIGSPSVTATSNQGFILRQGGNFTHGSASGSYVKPASCTAIANNSGIVVTAVFDVVTNAINNDVISVYWDGNITLS